MQLASDASAPDWDAIRQKGIDFGRRAVELAESAPGALADAAWALAAFGEDINAMIVLVDRALVLNPSYARGWHISGFLRLWAGQSDLAIEHARRALRLSPRAQARASSFLIGAALFFSRSFEEAVSRLRVAIEEMPVFPTPYRFLAASYGHLGMLDEARATIARLRDITPEVTQNHPLPTPPRHQFPIDGQLLAAIPRVRSSEAFGRRHSALTRVDCSRRAGIRNPNRELTFDFSSLMAQHEHCGPQSLPPPPAGWLCRGAYAARAGTPTSSHTIVL